MIITLSTGINITRENVYTGESITKEATKIRVLGIDFNFVNNNVIINCEYIDADNKFVAGANESIVPDNYKINYNYISDDFLTLYNTADTIENNIYNFLKGKYDFLNTLE